jgi:Leucine-rich repeat (LRR) protein
MVNNQNEFNEKYSHEEQEIKIRYKKFQGQLVIGNYPKLERLQLLKVNSIDKITLRNLVQLQECTIQGCSVVELVIENCSQIKTLNVRNNSLTNLEFLINLEKLEVLELDGNPELIETLKPYGGN